MSSSQAPIYTTVAHRCICHLQVIIKQPLLPFIPPTYPHSNSYHIELLDAVVEQNTAYDKSLEYWFEHVLWAEGGGPTGRENLAVGLLEAELFCAN
jgi:hypothetical protein